MTVASESPIDVVVDRVAAAVAKAWDQARSEQTHPTSEEGAAFLAIAYRYLSDRHAAVFAMERTEHMRDVERRYEAPPPTSRNYEPRPGLEALFMIFVAVLLMAGLFAAAFILSWLFQNIGTLLESLVRSLASGEALMLVLFCLIPLVISILGQRLFPRQLSYVFEGAGRVPWETFQAHSTKQIDSERGQILAMIGQSSDGGTIEPTIADDDLSKASESPVPIQPGVAEYVFSTNRVTIDDLGNDFRETKRQHTVVFWVTFMAFLGCLLCSVAAALVFKQDLKGIGGLGILSGVMGTFSYRMLGKARLARISLTMFNSYVIELHQRMEESKGTDDIREARKLRAAAWTNFRSGMNRLYALEQRTGARRS